MKVVATVINQGQIGECWLLTRREDDKLFPLYYAAGRYWKTKKGAENWAKKNGYDVEE